MKNLIRNFLLLVLILGQNTKQAFASSEPYIGEIQTFGLNFCPRGWAEANGQLLPISQNTALFSLFGTNFGGNGTSTFGLPDLRGRSVIGSGQGPGLSNRVIGQTGGAEMVTLTTNQIPAHTHGFQVKTGRGVTTNGEAAFVAESGIFRTNGTVDVLNASTISSSGGNQPHENMAPFLTMINCVALQGIFPSRP